MSVLGVADGCRRRAKPAPPAEGASDVEGVGLEIVGGGNAANPSGPISPAPAITNGVAPPPRVDANSGKLILQTDSTLLKKKTSTE